jgi:glutaminase
VNSPIQDYLETLHREFSGISEGEVATYIPELGKAKPNWFGICLVTATGTVYEVGVTRRSFTIQSISKPFVYGLALEDRGVAAVLEKIGMEPTGDAFNSISLEPGTGRPRNPMINAGAIATTSLITGKSSQIRLKRLVDLLGLYAGRDLEVDESVFLSENETGHGNRAIGHMLRKFDIISEDPKPSLDLYFKQCSVSVTARDLGTMAATLANNGVNPITGKQALRGEFVPSILSVMGTCGMYDGAGEWIYKIGMPSKSGVAGGIIAVMPGQFGIGVFSPPLDPQGNSVRGIRVCQSLSNNYDLHMLNCPSVGNSTIRMKCTAAEMNSKRLRTPREARILSEKGDSIRLYQLQGNLNFTTCEPVMVDVVENIGAARQIILDFKRVLTMNKGACRLLHDLIVKLSAGGRSMIFTHIGHHQEVLDLHLKAWLGKRFEKLYRSFDDNDLALEWCENVLLKQALPKQAPRRRVAVKEYELCNNLTANELKLFASLLKKKTYHKGKTIISIGEEPREIFLLASGNVSVFIPQEGGSRLRLATFSPAMIFGEMAVMDRVPRSAKIVADTEVECHVLSLENFDAMGDTHPALKIKLLENLNLGLCHRLRKTNQELSLFSNGFCI